MEIKNESWLPIVRDYAHMAKVGTIAMVFIEDVDAAGMFDPENDCIVINIAPNVLGSVADRYMLKPSQLEEIVMCVFLEECIHSQGVTDETTAAVMATMLSKLVPKNRLKTRGGMATYAKKMLKKIPRRKKEEKMLSIVNGNAPIALP